MFGQHSASRVVTFQVVREISISMAVGAKPSHKAEDTNVGYGNWGENRMLNLQQGSVRWRA